MRLPDGRWIAWTGWGAPQGRTVIAQPHLGVAGQRQLLADVGPLEAAGIRLVIVARGGIGTSARRPGRTEQTDAEDMVSIVDDLELERVNLLGECAGAGAVLAFAARWPERVQRVALVSAIAPLSGPDAPSYAGRLRRVPQSMRYGPIARWVVKRHAAALRRDPDRFLKRTWALMAEVDRALAREPARHAHAMLELVDFYSSADSVIDEWRSVIGPWSIDFDAIRAPVLIDHGELDRTAPVAMARWLGRRVASARVRIDPARGHFARPDRFAELVTELASEV